jgi:hypothetical protein
MWFMELRGAAKGRLFMWRVGEVLEKVPPVAG